MSHLLGIDVGSSSVKAALIEIATGTTLASAGSPATELPIAASQPGWAEQAPELWWEHVVRATRQVLDKAKLAGKDVTGIGISYQMHGLVCLDAAGAVLRPAIIWCDSRAVTIGEAAASAIGRKRCLHRLLNSPGNFTASKLAWVKEHEPELYSRVATIMLPGDWIAFRMSGERTGTASGLSEGILWDFVADAPAELVMKHYGFAPDILPRLVPTFGLQCELSSAAARELGLAAGTPIAYRAGDQPNNAFSLNVLRPGELAATAGTSAVVYGVSDQATADPKSRVNTFVHVNHRHQGGAARYGVLLCVNGSGICNSWLRRHTATVDGRALEYSAMNDLAAKAPIGSEGLTVLPYGNGAERTLGNKAVGGAVLGLDFNRHGRGHLLRAAQEGIVFSLKHGIDAMAAAGVSVDTVRAGHANLFLSPLFRQAFATVTGATVELYATDGAQGAARGAGLGIGAYATPADAFAGLVKKDTIAPRAEDRTAYDEAYARWSTELARRLKA